MFRPVDSCWHCSHRVYVYSVYLSVPAIDVCSSVRRIGCCVSGGMLRQRKGATAARRSAAKASSVTFAAAVAGWSQTCLLCFRHSIVIPFIDTAHVVSGAGSMKLSGVCLSIQPIIHTPFQQVGCWAPCQREIGLYTVSQKTRHLTLAHNFTKYSPIFKILSQLDSVGNL